MISAPIARIILRYTSAFLVGFGLMGDDVAAQVSNDPDLALLLSMAIGATLAALTERSWVKAGKP